MGVQCGLSRTEQPKNLQFVLSSKYTCFSQKKSLVVQFSLIIRVLDKCQKYKYLTQNSQQFFPSKCLKTMMIVKAKLLQDKGEGVSALVKKSLSLVLVNPA